jgi:hypothetical protein
MGGIAGRVLGSIVPYPFIVPFSSISAPNGLQTPDSECTQEQQQRDEGDNTHGAMHGGGDEDEDTTDAREDDSTDAAQRGEIRVQQPRHSLPVHPQCRQRW